MNEPHTENKGGSQGEELDARGRVYQGALSLMMNEAQLVWSRYNAMLTANSLIAVVLAAVLTKQDMSTCDLAILIAATVFGFILSLSWKRLTNHGWNLSHRWAEQARANWPYDQDGPLETYYTWCDTEGGDRIRSWGFHVINLFLLGYFLVGLGAIVVLIREYCRHVG